MVQLGTCGDWRVWNEDYRTAICFNEKAQGNCTLQVKIKKRNGVFTTNSDFRIPISLQPDFETLCYFKH